MKAKTKLILAIAAAAVVLLAVAMIFFPRPLTEKLALTDPSSVVGAVMLPSTPGEVSRTIDLSVENTQRLMDEITGLKARYAGRFSVVYFDAPLYHVTLRTDSTPMPSFDVDCEGYIYIKGNNVGGKCYRLSSGRLYALLAELHYTAQAE